MLGFNLKKDGVAAMRKISFLFLALTLVLLTFPASSTFAAADFPNTSTNGMTGFAGQAKSENGATKPATTGEKAVRLSISII